jgi:smad nuclear-interacting protein 1
MPRDSRSPPRRRRYDDRDNGYESKRPERTDHGGSRRDRERDSKREAGRYGYSEKDRETERRRDRDRYNDRAGSSRNRRSASPSRRRSGSPSRRRRSSRSRSRSAEPEPENKAKPNFGASGLLAAETNTVKSVDGKNSTVLKYNEPPEARKPIMGWRLYVFRGEEQLGMWLFTPTKHQPNLFSRTFAHKQTKRISDRSRQTGRGRSYRAPFLFEATRCHTM